MDLQTLWGAITEIQKHVSVINSELNATMTDVAWLKASWWELLAWMRVIGSGVVVGIALSIWNIAIHKK